MGNYIPLAVMLALATIISVGMVAASHILGPKKPSSYKSSSYECGITPVGTARERFPIKFYLIAMLFIVFDIETIFLYPWAVTYARLPYALKLFEFGEMAIFVVILFVGYFYILGKGALDWDESEQTRSGDRITPEVAAPRPTLRYGNENSGPVSLENTQAGIQLPSYGASSQEQGIQPATPTQEREAALIGRK
jgi:NADH-quinone oxidoreductase subunit A